MAEYYILRNPINNLYYHSLLPNGIVLWVDERDSAAYLLEADLHRVSLLIDVLTVIESCN